MKKFYRYLILFPLIFCFIATVWAIDNSDSFVVKKIEIVGSRSISEATVLNYLPISVGDEFTDAKSNAIIQSLYQSGFFTNVNLSREGNTLVVSVAESATISSVKVVGNSAIKKDDMQTALNSAGLITGNVYSRAALNDFKQQIASQYHAMGYYAATVDVQVQNLPRGRVAITVNIKSGKVATVESINFIGNNAFSSRTLRRQMYITTPKLWSFLTKGDQYSKPKLNASLERIQAFYMDRGYLRFKIVSTSVALSPDHKTVNIVIKVSEGAQYKFSGYTFSGNTILPPAQLSKAVVFEKGDIFSRDKLEQSDKAIAFALGDYGYAFANITPIPTISDVNKTVFINFNIVPGNKVYVRRIIFRGNTITADYVLRRAMQQMEGGLLSSRNVEESVRKLKLLGFFSNVQVQTVPVPGTNNQVDLIYNVTETAAGQATVSVGYGTLGWQLGAGINQPNFLGTGRTVGVNFSTSSYQTSYTINYYNPYYTLNNIGRGVNLFYTTTNPGNLNLSENYALNTYGGNVYYTIPVSLNNSFSLGYGFSHIQLRTFACSASEAAAGTCTPVSTEITNFVNKYGNNFNELTLNSGWQYMGLDRAIFPTQGLSASVTGEASAPVFGDSLKYYKVGSSAHYYLPLNRAHSFVLQLDGNLGYGNGYDNTIGLPFFMNYYAGGLAQGLVRGYETNTLGPRDSNNDPLGGNVLVDGSVNLIFPNPISPDNLRTSIFLDAGNTFQTMSSLYTFSPGPIRLSAGLGVQWRSPMGPIDVSLGAALNKQPGDELEPFQFTMGTSF